MKSILEKIALGTVIVLMWAIVIGAVMYCLAWATYEIGMYNL